MRKSLRLMSRAGYVVATLVITFALLVSVGRLMTPYLNDHLPNFETWSKDFLKIPVKIRHVEIIWNLYEPELSFQNVTLLDKKTQKPYFSVQEIKVNLNIIRSIFTWQPVTDSIIIRGAHLTVVETPKGLPLVEEFKELAVVDNVTATTSQMADVVDWILN